MRKYIHVIIIVISVATILSGLIQIVVPGFVLKFVGADITPTTNHFFAIVGMFMFLFGCLMINTVYSTVPNPSAVLWSALQKLGAAVAVAIGIMHGIFSLTAGGVAIFDFCSGLLFLYYIKLLKEDEAR